MLLELSVAEERYHAVMEVCPGSRRPMLLRATGRLKAQIAAWLSCSKTAANDGYGLRMMSTEERPRVRLGFASD